MNHIYKLKFDKRRNELVVVSELTSGVGKAKATGSVEGGKALRRGVRTMALSLLSGMIMMAHPVTAANLPTGGQIVAGSGNIQTPSGNQMNIHQHSQNMVANWNSFDIGKGNTVQFFQPDSSAVALNRVVGGGESQIMGNLKANGQVFLVNPNGVLFGKDASVSTSGFVASTRDIKNDDFMNRRYTFSGGQKAGAAIVNQGALTTNAGGYIVLAADRVSNSGTIRTPDGKAVLAATERVTLQLDNGGLTSVQVTGDVVNALVENRGLVSARNGQVFLTAHGRDMLMNTVLNVSGVVEAGGMHRRDGNIVLDGGNSGVVHLSGSLQADNASGKGGKIVVQGQNLLLDKGSSITATGSQGGGEVYVGGGWQGKDAGIRNADKVVMQDSALIDVSATDTGNGGTAVLWSESFTNFRGQISAKGGEQGGNGGKVETSSRGNLQAFGTVTASAKKGLAGNWLLDPADITIVSGTSDTNVSNSNGIFTPNSTNSRVANTTINNRLNNGTSVTIQTSHASTLSKGNTTVRNAGSLLEINNSTLSGKNLTLEGNQIGENSRNLPVYLNNATLTTEGGNITLTGRSSNGSNAAQLELRATNTLTANNGSIIINHDKSDGASNTSALLLNGNNTLNATNGNISLMGNWTRFIYNDLDDHAVVKINGNANLISTGGINISGTGSQTGVAFGNVSVVLKGNTSITGTGASGVVFAGIVNINATGYNVSINGNATSNTGLYIKRAGVLFQQRYWSGGNIHITAKTINVNGSSNTNASGVEGIIYSYNGNQYTNVTLNASNISIIGSSKNGDGVRFDNLTTITENASIRGVSNGSGSGVQIAGNLSNTTINGSSQSGNGVTVSTVKAWGGLNPGNLTGDGNSSITGSSDTGNGVSIWGNVSGVNFINGSSSNASGNGSGVDINGSVNGGQISGNASGNGNGVNISGNITDGNITGNA
ncbi:TPA: filamentous hemagglutinin N-terminal domain-containing protein, partial [Escherichia coli]